MEAPEPLNIVFPEVDDPFVAEVRRSRWDEIEDIYLNSAAVSASFMLRVVRLTRGHDKLGRLFPGIVMGALTLSRSSGEPSNDCPTIDVDRAGVYGVAAWTYPKPLATGSPPPQLGELTSDPADAVEIAASGLPLTWSTVWIGCPSRRTAERTAGIE